MLYQIELLTYLTGFFVHRMFVAEATVFLVFDTAWLVSPVFSRGIILLAAYFALQRYLISWHQNLPCLFGSTRKVEPMTRIELVTSSLPRMRSTD